MGKTSTESRRAIYEELETEREKEFRAIADAFTASGNLKLFKEGMRQGLKEHYIQTALVAKGGRLLTARDRQDLGLMLAATYDYLDGFTKELGKQKALSVAQSVARAGSYAAAWGVFTRFGLPAALAEALPALPGIDCLGAMRCGCWLEWEVGNKSVDVYWHINPIKEHCVLCLDFTAEWNPLTLEIQDLNSELLDEEKDFFYED